MKVGLICFLLGLDGMLALERLAEVDPSLGDLSEAVPWSQWLEGHPEEAVRYLKGNLAIAEKYHPDSSSGREHPMNGYFEEQENWGEVIHSLVQNKIDPWELLEGAVDSPKKKALEKALGLWEISTESDPDLLLRLWRRLKGNEVVGLAGQW